MSGSEESQTGVQQIALWLMQVMRRSSCLSLPTDKMNNKADDAVQNTKMSSCHDLNRQQSLVTKPMAAELSVNSLGVRMLCVWVIVQAPCRAEDTKPMVQSLVTVYELVPANGYCELWAVSSLNTGSPVVKTPHFQCRGHIFDPWLEN